MGLGPRPCSDFKVGVRTVIPENQRIAIAQACGWKRVEWIGRNGRKKFEGWHSPDKRLLIIPDYLNDLNSMHEAVASLSRETLDYSNYGSFLAQGVAIENRKSLNRHTHTCEATASQRAEAFLRTLSLWTE